MAASSTLAPRRWRLGLRRVLRAITGLLGGVLAADATRAVTLPEDTAEGMYHVYKGGGLTAQGPALLVRKGMFDRVSLSASYYVDAVSSASIDVVTSASPFKETRNEYGVGLDYIYRDAQVTLGVSKSKEPDYVADAVSVDVAQEVFGGMTSVSLGYTRGSDKVGRKDTAGYFDAAHHWQYRLGVTQILTPRWLLSLNGEAISDEGFLGSPYRVALSLCTPDVSGSGRLNCAATPERVPRTRTSRSVKLRTVGGIGTQSAVRAEYRYFWDTWSIRSHTGELGYGRTFGDRWLGDAYLRYYKQSAALFYSDNALQETTFISRNRQLSTFNTLSLGAKVSYTAKKVPGRYEIKINGALERVRYKFNDFTDIRDGKLYTYDANVLQVFVSAAF